MKKILSVLAVLLCATLLCSCSSGSEAKLFTSQGDAALEAGDYESALEFYTQAADTGDATNRVKVLCEILSSYIEAKEAYDDENYEKAAEILDDLEYDYNSYAPINSDMRELVRDVDTATKSIKRIDRALDELAEAIAESDYDTAYELINELDGYDLDEIQSEELEYQVSRMLRKQENTKDDEPEREPEQKPEKEPEKEPESTPEEKPEQTSSGWYRVRKDWNDPSSQISAFKTYENAVKEAKANPGYKVYDENGKVLYP